MTVSVDRMPLAAANTLAPALRREVRKVRLGIVGCGRVAEQCHIPAAIASSEVDVAALADSNPERLDRVAGNFGLSCFATSSPPDLIGRVDAVVLSLPNHLHYPVGSEFLGAGVHVLCEKPLANSTREARRLCELAEARGVVLAVGYMKRFEPNCGLMKRLLEEGFLGRLDHFELEHGTAGGWAPLSNYNLQREQAGGGVLMTNGCHLLDRVIDWFGYPFRVSYSDDSHGGVEANCTARFDFESGLTGRINLSKTRTLCNRFRLYGERGCIEVPSSQRASVTYFPAGDSRMKHEISEDAPKEALSDTDYFRLQIQDFVRAIETGGYPRASGRDGLASLELIEECYRARTPLPELWVSDPVTTANHDARVRRVRAARSSETAATGVRSVLVTGGTGFVGSRLCEVLHMGTDYHARPFVHSSGRAAYIARYPMDFTCGDLTDLSSVRRAIEGCSFVVHLARGSDKVMIAGLENVLRAAVETEVRRFVHVSSVRVYGDNPPPSATSEEAVPCPTGNPYGDIKLEQEHIVRTFGRKFGLPVVILRPPHVFGPYSHFVDAVVRRLRNRALPIVDGGVNVCNLVYIDNLVEAILLCLDKEESIGETFFVTDIERVTWRKCLEDFGSLVGVHVPTATQDQLDSPVRPTVAASALRMSRVLLSHDFRSAALDMPGCARFSRMLSQVYAALPEKQRNYIRSRVRTPAHVPGAKSGVTRYNAADYLIMSQGRTVVHACDKAQRVLGYTGAVGYTRAMDLTRAWMEFAQLAPEHASSGPE